MYNRVLFPFPDGAPLKSRCRESRKSVQVISKPVLFATWPILLKHTPNDSEFDKEYRKL